MLDLEARARLRQNEQANCDFCALPFGTFWRASRSGSVIAEPGAATDVERRYGMLRECVSAMNEWKPRKLLKAAVGVATVSYVIGCGARTSDRGDPDHVVAPPDPHPDPGWSTSGNLVAPPPQPDPTTTPRTVDPDPGWSTSGNLVAPPPYPDPTGISPPKPELVDAGYATSGNLVAPPPVEAGADSGQITSEDGVVPGPRDAGIADAGGFPAVDTTAADAAIEPKVP